MARKRVEPQGWYKPDETQTCPLCSREIPPGERSEHHLVPKLKGGRQKVVFHKVCHQQIHALFSESELARDLNTVEALLEHPAIQKFVQWVKTKPIAFRGGTKQSDRRR